MTKEQSLEKIDDIKTLVERARRRTIGCCSYRRDMNLSLEMVRDLAVAEELLNELIEYLQQDDVLLLTAITQGNA